MARTTVRDLENVILSMQQRVHEQGAKIQQLEAQVARLAVVAQSQQQQQGSSEALSLLQQLMEENEGYTQGCYIPEAYAEMNISRQRRIYKAVLNQIQANAS